MAAIILISNPMWTYPRRTRKFCMCEWVGVTCFNLSETYVTTGSAYIHDDIEICQVLWPSDQFLIGPPPPLSGKAVVPHFWIVHLVSLIAPKRIEPITWNWYQFEDILEENMVNFQNKWWGASRGPHGGPNGLKWPKLTKILNFLGFGHHPFH